MAEAAGIERPELAKKLALPSEALPYLAFRSAVQGILTEAQNEKELLARFGMVEPAPSGLGEALGQFDRAVERGVSGRRAHVGARAELEAIADEVVQQVDSSMASSASASPAIPKGSPPGAARGISSGPRGREAEPAPSNRARGQVGSGEVANLRKLERM